MGYPTSFKTGDLVIGSFVQLCSFYAKDLYDPRHPERVKCGGSSLTYLRHYLAFIYAVEEINKNSQILPNITLGYQIFDSCGCDFKAISGVLDTMSGAEQTIPNYDCRENNKLVGVLGDLSSGTSHTMAQLLAVFRYPQISYGAMDPVFHDRTQFPSFYRTIPNEEAEMDGIVQILKHFGWKWVGLIVSDDDTGYRARERISTELARMGGCLAFSLVIEYDTDMPYLREMIFETIKKTPVKVLFMFISTKYIFFSIDILIFCIIPERFCITSSVFANFINSPYNVGLTVLFNGALSLLIQEGEIPQFNHFLNSFSLSDYPQSELTEYMRQDAFYCTFLHFSRSDNKPTDGRICTGNESMSKSDFSQTGNYRVTYRVYTAVYALARALHNLYSAQAPTNHWDKLEYMRGNLKPWQDLLILLLS
ncbi:hypothetical protein XENTR_v10015287 [Xenopus tropicalis]|nr:hypothetical protein XENTR_v10015287 [Xenopus tropicalis]